MHIEYIIYNNTMTTLQKIQDIEAEMARTQKNKATNAHLGLLKAKLSKLKRELVDGTKGGGVGFLRGDNGRKELVFHSGEEQVLLEACAKLGGVCSKK